MCIRERYYYEKAQMAFIDTDPRITLAYGVAGLSIAIDSLSAIKYAKVTARRNEIGLTEGFDTEAVSYTHLDVYKRQGEGNPGAAHRKQQGHEANGRGREA